MVAHQKHAGNVVLLRGATLWLLAALILAWCLVLMKADVAFIHLIFKDFDRLLQAHIDFLLMSALILGFYAARVALPWHVRWSMVIGAFTNSSLFVLQSAFPALGGAAGATEFPLYSLLTLASIVITTYGFGMGAILVFRSTFNEN